MDRGTRRGETHRHIDTETQDLGVKGESSCVQYLNPGGVDGGGGLDWSRIELLKTFLG